MIFKKILLPAFVGSAFFLGACGGDDTPVSPENNPATSSAAQPFPLSSSSVIPQSSSSVEKKAEKAYQAEKGTINGGVVESSNIGFNGEGYVNFDKGGDFTIPVKVDAAGLYKFDIDFSNGSGESRSLTISVGESRVEQAFDATVGWTTWETVSVNLNLAAGENTVKFATLDGKDGPNIDQFDVTLVKAADSSGQGLGLAMNSAALALARNFRVSLYNTNGLLVRKIEVAPARIGDMPWITRSLPAGVYVMRVQAPGVDRRSFVVVK